MEKIHTRKKYKNIFSKKEHIPKSHVLRDGIKEISYEDIETINKKVIRHAKENKLFRNGTIDGLTVVGFDGSETFSTTKRDWNGSYKVKKKVIEYINNEKVEVEKEYHKQINVFAQTVGRRPNLILGYENVTCNGHEKKQEYEPNVGIKLLDKIKNMFGTGIDVIVGDAIYMDANFLKAIIEHGYNAVIRLKDNRKKLIEDAEGLFKLQKSKIIKFGKTKIECWRESLEYNKIKIDVLKFVENETNTIYVACTSNTMDEKTINKIIHARWDIENNGFNELKNYWNMNHCYVADENGINVMLQFIILSYNLWELYIYSHIHKFDELKITKLGYIEMIIEKIQEFKCGYVQPSSA